MSYRTQYERVGYEISKKRFRKSNIDTTKSHKSRYQLNYMFDVLNSSLTVSHSAESITLESVIKKSPDLRIFWDFEIIISLRCRYYNTVWHSRFKFEIKSQEIYIRYFFLRFRTDPNMKKNSFRYSLFHTTALAYGYN